MGFSQGLLDIEILNEQTGAPKLHLSIRCTFFPHFGHVSSFVNVAFRMQSQQRYHSSVEQK